jgi:hypothetical protein
MRSKGIVSLRFLCRSRGSGRLPQHVPVVQFGQRLQSRHRGVGNSTESLAQCLILLVHSSFHDNNDTRVQALSNFPIFQFSESVAVFN